MDIKVVGFKPPQWLYREVFKRPRVFTRSLKLNPRSLDLYPELRILISQSY